MLFIFIDRRRERRVIPVSSSLMFPTVIEVDLQRDTFLINTDANITCFNVDVSFSAEGIEMLIDSVNTKRENMLYMKVNEFNYSRYDKIRESCKNILN